MVTDFILSLFHVVLCRDFPQENLKLGDVAVLVDFVPHPSGGETGANSHHPQKFPEIFVALGDLQYKHFRSLFLLWG